MRDMTLAAMAVCLSAGAALADGWTLDPGMSDVSFGSIKNDYVGETHHFGKVGGTVADDGTVTLTVDLTSVQTNIDIRNERMVQYVFTDAPTATITARIDMAEVQTLEIGEAMNVDSTGTLSLMGTDTDLDASFFVLRLRDDRLLVTTNGTIMLSTEDAGIDAGIDKLQELAGLDSIARVSPITLRLVFDRES